MGLRTFIKYVTQFNRRPNVMFYWSNCAGNCDISGEGDRPAVNNMFSICLELKCLDYNNYKLLLFIDKIKILLSEAQSSMFRRSGLGSFTG